MRELRARQCFLMLVVCAFWLASVSTAVAANKKIVSDGSAPSIYGNKVVYETDSAVYLYDRSTGDREQISYGSSDPDIWGSNIVYADDRDGNWNVYLFNRTTGRERQLTSSAADESGPAIYGSTVVYTVRAGDRTGVYSYELRSGTRERLFSVSSNEMLTCVDIYGSKVVYSFDSGISIYDMNTGSRKRLLSNGEYSAWSSPSLYKNRLVCQYSYANEGYESSIYYYNIATGTKRKIANGDGEPGSPAIYDYRVVYSRYVDSGSAVYLHKLPPSKVGTPNAPETMHEGTWYTVKGVLKPRHTEGTSPIRIYAYKKIDGEWKKIFSCPATVQNYSSYSQYKVKMWFKGRGTWRLRALHPADSKHGKKWSKYEYVTVTN